jgi:hypothetical protein
MTTIINWSETSEKYLKSLNGDLRSWCNEVRNISDLHHDLKSPLRLFKYFSEVSLQFIIVVIQMFS